MARRPEYSEVFTIEFELRYPVAMATISVLRAWHKMRWLWLLRAESLKNAIKNWYTFYSSDQVMKSWHNMDQSES
jgi:hypothetical protein